MHNNNDMNTMIALNGERPPLILDDYIAGVGMIRSEYILRHVVKYIPSLGAQQALSNYLDQVCTHYYPKPVWYRTSELTTQEVNVLECADEIINEKHYEIGLRGIRRGVKHIGTLRKELSIVSAAAQKYDNLNILLPYITDTEEFKICRQILDDLGFKGRVGVMLEIPSVFFLIKEFIDCGVDCFTVGINDLTMLVLGAYRGSEFHNTSHSAVIKLISQAERIVHNANLEFNIAGYIDKTFLSSITNIPVDNLIIHYKDFPKLFGFPNKTDLPDINLVDEIKIDTKKRITEYNERNKSYIP